ncbi:uncharacterized protein CANTADRAFT_169688 [Suhomyces tanzawaensis NRRL Y-17324]|uniref:Autophagy-related protein 25 n=1 Tax=Suhomyces tanzawaensis NRRL Y-17324 TaxID=984487 RepID=A0A1E4SMF2_9ASCO|nr:uncharacterized protein CANTADRAFT_169688 [Suhomyces tanzawaensis NRRL Y-17324]ODV80690.1 hypothetical protein CANTADRAFT_169688 [Suhomyces tanzawaensis NRRL Y-17324]
MSDLDLETIRNAADIINSMLILRAYIDDEIKFNCINWDDLVQDQIHNKEAIPKLDELKVTETIYNNDKNIINIIHSLVGAVDRSRNHFKLSNQTISQKDATIEKLNKRIESLENQVESYQSQLNRTVQVDQSKLNQRIASLTKHNKLQAQDLNKLKSWINDMRSKYQIELKKKTLEIDELKNKLVDKRNLSSTTVYGIPLSSKGGSPAVEESFLKSNVIYNNNPIIDNTTGVQEANGTNVANLKSLVNKEYEDMIADLTPIIESLVVENFKYSKFIDVINQYYSGFNNQFSDQKLKNGGLSFPNPSGVIDLNEISKTNPETIKKYLDEMESFEFAAKPLLNNLYKFYHNISGLIQLIDASSNKSDPDGSRLKQLEKELESVKKNWKDALAIAENWKNYQQSKT